MALASFVRRFVCNSEIACALAVMCTRGVLFGVGCVSGDAFEARFSVKNAFGVPKKAKFYLARVEPGARGQLFARTGSYTGGRARKSEA